MTKRYFVFLVIVIVMGFLGASNSVYGCSGSTRCYDFSPSGTGCSSDGYPVACTCDSGGNCDSNTVNCCAEGPYGCSGDCSGPTPTPGPDGPPPQIVQMGYAYTRGYINGVVGKTNPVTSSFLTTSCGTAPYLPGRFYIDNYGTTTRQCNSGGPFEESYLSTNAFHDFKIFTNPGQAVTWACASVTVNSGIVGTSGCPGGSGTGDTVRVYMHRDYTTHIAFYITDGMQILGRVWGVGEGVTRVTKCPGCTYGSAVCTDSPVLNKPISISGVSGTFPTSSCNSGGAYYSGTAPYGSRTVSIPVTGDEVITWTCGAVSQGGSTAGVCPAASGPGNSVTVNSVAGVQTHVHFYVQSPRCTISGPAGPVCATANLPPTSYPSYTYSATAGAGGGTNRLAVQGARSVATWNTEAYGIAGVGNPFVLANGTAVSGAGYFSVPGTYVMACNAYNTVTSAQASSNPWCWSGGVWTSCLTWMDSGAAGRMSVTAVSAPANPVTVTATDAINSIRLNWTDVSGETGYNIYRSDGGAYTLLTATPLPADTVTYTDTTMTCGTPYTYSVRPVASGNPAECQVSGGTTANANCIVYDSWFAAQGSDVVGAGGQLSATIPSGQYLIDAGSSGIAGVAIAAPTGFSGITSTNVSTNRWLLSLSSSLTTMMTRAENTYAAIRERILAQVRTPLAISGTVNETTLLSAIAGMGGSTDARVDGVANGLIISRTIGDVTLEGPMDVGNNRILLLVEGNVRVRTTDAAGAAVRVNDNSGFFGVFATGTVTVDPGVGEPTPHTDIRLSGYQAHMEGIWLGTNFVTESAGAGITDRQLRIDGAVIGLNGVSFNRNIAGPYPAEYVVFRPDLNLTLHQVGLRRKIIQELVNP